MGSPMCSDTSKVTQPESCRSLGLNRTKSRTPELKAEHLRDLLPCRHHSKQDHLLELTSETTRRTHGLRPTEAFPPPPAGDTSALQSGLRSTPWRPGAPWWPFGEQRHAPPARRSALRRESSAFFGLVTDMENIIQSIPSSERTPGVERGWGPQS